MADEENTVITTTTQSVLQDPGSPLQPPLLREQSEGEVLQFDAQFLNPEEFVFQEGLYSGVTTNKREIIYHR